MKSHIDVSTIAAILAQRNLRRKQTNNEVSFSIQIDSKIPAMLMLWGRLTFHTYSTLLLTIRKLILQRNSMLFFASHSLECGPSLRQSPLDDKFLNFYHLSAFI